MFKDLVNWIEHLKEEARKDNCFAIDWFKDTKDKPFSIIAGWMEGFSEEYSDLLCISAADPEYALCVKIAVNDGRYACPDFEYMDMPVDDSGDVDDTCIALEYDDDPEGLATFLMSEWERITDTYID
jgi:hypothetical protein